MYLANMNKEGMVLHYHLLGLVSTTTCLGCGEDSSVTINGELVMVCDQWKMESHPVTRSPESPAPVPSPRAWAVQEWRLAMELYPRYADYEQWSLRII